MLASQYQSSDWNQHTTNQSRICWRNLLAPGTMHEKSSHETSLDLDSCFDHNKVRSHQQALGNLTNAWTPVGLSPITLLSSFFTFNKSLGFTVSCVYHRSMNEGCKRSRWFSGIYTTWMTCSRHNTNQVIRTNILLIRVVAVQVKAGLVWTFLLHVTKSQKVPPTDTTRSTKSTHHSRTGIPAIIKAPQNLRQGAGLLFQI